MSYHTKDDTECLLSISNDKESNTHEWWREDTQHHGQTANQIRTENVNDDQITLPVLAHSQPRHHVLIALCILSFILRLPNSLVDPFLPGEAISRGVSSAWIGAMFASCALAMVISGPQLGRCVSAVGPKYVILIGTAFAGVLSCLFSLVDQLGGGWFIFIVMTIRVAQGLACSATETGATALLASTYPNDISRIVGLMDACESLGFCLGPFLGGVLYEMGGFPTPFIVIGVTMLLAMLPLPYLLPDPLRHTVTQHTHSPTRTAASLAMARHRVACENDTTFDYERMAYYSLSLPESSHETYDLSIRALFRIEGLPCAIIAAVSGMAALSFVEPTLQPHFAKRGFSPLLVGALFMLMSFVYVVCAIIFSLFVTPARTKYILGAGHFICSIGLFLIGPTPIPLLPDSTPLLIVAIVLLSIGSAIVFVPIVPYVVSLTQHKGEEATGVVAGLLTSAFSLGEALGPLSGGLLMQVFSFRITSTIVGILILLIGVYVFSHTDESLVALPNRH